MEKSFFGHWQQQAQTIFIIGDRITICT